MHSCRLGIQRWPQLGACDAVLALVARAPAGVMRNRAVAPALVLHLARPAMVLEIDAIARRNHPVILNHGPAPPQEVDGNGSNRSRVRFYGSLACLRGSSRIASRSSSAS